MVIEPGDVVLADIDGANVVPRALAYNVRLRAQEAANAESEVKRRIREGMSAAEVVERGGYFQLGDEPIWLVPPEIEMTQPGSETRIDRGLLGLQLVCTAAHALNVCIDPRLELLAVVQWFSDYGDRYPLLTRDESDYRQAIEEHFAQYRDHESVRCTNALISRPFSYEAPPFAFGAPPEVMLYLGPDGELREDIYANAFLVGRAGGKESLQQFISQLLLFFRDSDFAGFYAAQQPFYTELVSRTIAKIGERDHIAELERFYGMQLGSYTLILVPLYHSVGFGPLITVAGIRHIYNVMGPRRTQGGVPDFGSEAYFAEMQRHEFSHGFVNPLTEEHWEAAAPYFAGYDSPLEAQELANESIVRAVTTWLAYADGETLGKRALRQEKARGFEVVEALVQQIDEYARSRETYPTFAAFYPQLLEVFRGHTKARYTSQGTARSME